MCHALKKYFFQQVNAVELLNLLLAEQIKRRSIIVEKATRSAVICFTNVDGKILTDVVYENKKSKKFKL